MAAAGDAAARLATLAQATVDAADRLAVFLVFDRPSRVAERPGLSRAYFAERCASDRYLAEFIEALRSVGAYVQLVEGETELVAALASGRLQAVRKPLKLVYNGVEGGVTLDGFKPGRKALVPTLADAYGLPCANSDGYACAIGRHKYHYFTLMRSLGLPAPEVWHYRPDRGWAGDHAPPTGRKVIAKSTYESWSVGVSDDSVFVVDEWCTPRVHAVAEQIGQAVTVQEFVSGPEVKVPVFSDPVPFGTTPVEVILAKAPGDPDAITTFHDNVTGSAIRFRPFPSEPAIIGRLEHTASRVFDVLQLSGFARIDFRVDAEGREWVTDVGVSPWLSVDDSAMASVAELGLDHPAFLRAVVGASLVSHGML